MKRVFGAFLILFCCVIFSSCRNTPALNTTVPLTAEIVDRDITYSVSIEKSDDNVILKLLSPENVNGISYRYESDKLTIEYEGLRCISDNNRLPESAFQNALYQAIGSIPEAVYQRSDGGMDDYSAEDGRFLITAADGEIHEIHDTKYGFVFTFQD